MKICILPQPLENFRAGNLGKSADLAVAETMEALFDTWVRKHPYARNVRVDLKFDPQGKMFLLIQYTEGDGEAMLEDLGA